MFCDSLEPVIRIVDGAIVERQLAAYRSGALDSLSALRTRWHNLIQKQGWVDSLAQFSGLPLDSNVLHRIVTLRQRLTRDLAEGEPQLIRLVDSLTRDWLVSGERGQRYATPPKRDDSLRLPSRTARRRFFIATHAGGDRYREWFGRLARMRNQNSRALGYTSALHIALNESDISREWVEEKLTALDSSTERMYQVALDSIRSFYGESLNGALEPADVNYYQLSGPVELDTLWDRLTRRRALKRIMRNLTSLGLNLETLPIELDTTTRFSAALQPVALNRVSSGPAVVFVGSLRQPCTVHFVNDLVHALARAVASALSGRAGSSVWNESVALTLSQLLFSANDLIALLRVPPEARGATYRWHDRSALIDQRARMCAVEFELELYANPNRPLDEVYRDIYYRWLTVQPQRGAHQFAQDFWTLKSGPTYHRELIASLVSSQLYTHGLRTIGDFAALKDWREYIAELTIATADGRSWQQALLAITGERLSDSYAQELFNQLGR